MVAALRLPFGVTMSFAAYRHRTPLRDSCCKIIVSKIWFRLIASTSWLLRFAFFQYEFYECSELRELFGFSGKMGKMNLLGNVGKMGNVGKAGNQFSVFSYQLSENSEISELLTADETAATNR